MLKAKYLEENAVVAVEVVASEKERKELIEKAEAKAVKNLKVPGFRKGGKLPKHVVDKYLDKVKVYLDATSMLVNLKYNEALKLAQEEAKAYGQVWGQPEIAPKNVENLTVELVFAVLPSEDKIKFDGVKQKVKKDLDVKAYVERMLEEAATRYATKEVVEEPAKLGDIVDINFKGFINNEAFEGGEAEGYELKLGSKQFIDTFEDQLVGKEKGWKGDVVVKFPENYYVREYQNQEATFEVLVNSVQRMVMPELTDENIKMFAGGLNVETVADLKVELEKIAKGQVLSEAKSEFMNGVVAELVQLNELKISQAILAPYIKNLNEKFNSSLKQQGIKRAEYLRITKSTEEDVLKEMQDAALLEFKNEFISNALFNKFKAKAKEELIEAEYAKIAQMHNLEVDKVKELIKVDSIKNFLSSKATEDAIVKHFDAKGYERLQKLEA
ncbi:trigger factor [Mycoplasma sp. Ms02]|uniref:trigger factor n=1 Tax=Mycoplasma sp. Ms02 TaxID=353851 RepID=UPI001C88F233|nr:trigger factor [Mycoplasma sp. Ms02]QZE12194.1 trigger factor [Mycoplasma sp. Ms02]